MMSMIDNGRSEETGPTAVKLLMVVGFDGTDPSKRALEAAAEMLRVGQGEMDVVFVGHTPAGAAFSPGALTEVNAAFDTMERDLTRQAAELLDGQEVRWHFHRRDGEIARELLAAGKELLDANGPDARVVLVVGGCAHKLDRYLNSVPARIVRQDRFRVVVVP
jgi:nucleotide-binding universal stress UspA family protein